MSDRARRKERQRLKREKKKLAQRRAASASPYKRIGSHGEVEACYINSNWQETGLAAIYVVRENPQGGHALGSFLIDIWCAGLKDAFGFLDLDKQNLDHQFEHARGQFDLTRIDIETARKFVAAGIRFARQNGFRLPAHYDRWVNLLGGAGDVERADLTAFGKDGKLRWVGPMDDLRQRLIGSTVEEFLSRSDVDFITEGPESFFDDKDQSEDEDEDEDEDEEEEEDEDDAVESLEAELFDRVAGAYADGIESMAKDLAPKLAERLADRSEAVPENLNDMISSFFLAESAQSLMEGSIDGSDGNDDVDTSDPATSLRLRGCEILSERLQQKMNWDDDSLMADMKRIAPDYAEITRQPGLMERLSADVVQQLARHARLQIRSTFHPTPQIPGGH